MTNGIIIAELEKFLNDMDFFTIYPSRASLQSYLRNAVSDGDKIRAVLRDEYVQRELFSELSSSQLPVDDPLRYYLKMRRQM